MTRVPVKPEMIQWACSRAGLDIAALKSRFPKIQEWIKEESHPTFRQLEEFSKATHAPVGYFFLASPPDEPVPIPDFRTMTGKAVHRPSANLLDTIYICQQRQEWYREFARVTNEQPAPFIGSVSTKDDVLKVAESIRDALAFDLDERRQMATWEAALRRFIEQAENLGILVMVSGVVGTNNLRKLDPQEFRGFALSDPFAPLVFINGSDTKAAQMFTLAHELAHLWLGESALTDAVARSVPSNAVERWCNQVAAELLVPLEMVAQTYNRQIPLLEECSRLARRFKVSTLVILRRIHDTGAIPKDQFWRAYDAEVDRLRNIPRTSGGDYYQTTATRVSKKFAAAVITNTWEGRSTFTEAFRLLGCRNVRTLETLGERLGMTELLRGGAA